MTERTTQKKIWLKEKRMEKVIFSSDLNQYLLKKMFDMTIIFKAMIFQMIFNPA
jgi:hypothetical protein